MIQVQAEIEQPIEHGLRNLKVLLAEDNEVNQLLAKSILQYWGLESKVATTGNEVLNLINKEEFDVILMDIQMPEKSGIEATREIRNLLDPKKKNIPIIALTANALKGEEQKYRAVGMDDFLTKPFKAKELEDVILRVIKNEGAFGRDLNNTPANTLNSTVKEATNVTTAEKLYDLKSVHDIARGSEDFVLMLVKIFLDTIPADSKAMVQACEEKKWDSVSKLAHKLKSTIDTMHMVSIKENIRTVEADAKQGINKELLPAMIQKINNVIESTATHLRKEFNLA
jgi:CheY-like chemotaxis protein